jgi:hypothetical protein
MYALAVGPRADRYLKLFRRFEQGRWLSWNWAAFFFTLGWLCYRKLFGAALVYFIVSAPLLVMYMLLVSVSDACTAALGTGSSPLEYAMLAWLAAIYVVPGLFADRLYYRVLSRRLDRPLDGVDEQSFVLGLGVARSASLAYVPALLIVYYFASGYGNLAGRTYVSSVLRESRNYTDQVSAFYGRHGRLPAAAELPLNVPEGDGRIRSATLRSDGSIEFVAAGAPIRNHMFRYVPAAAKDALTWKLQTETIPDACLPASLHRGEPGRS